MLGFAMGKCMIISGAKVILVGRRWDVLVTPSAEIGSALNPEVFDVTEVGNIPALITRIQQEYGGIDILINNDGIHCKKPVEKAMNDDFKEVHWGPTLYRHSRFPRQWFPG
ncbi:MAG: SDR family NAD(P)-dependent oxidoreductase [Rhizobiales bacterium]|jgi:gluconate 5-dehydrogenase|nr:SDR family NAD(P)-dependent oxidoreductase [Hyphomicrobiales bacterium]